MNIKFRNIVQEMPGDMLFMLMGLITGIIIKTVASLI
jgi:hypothetical protein